MKKKCIAIVLSMICTILFAALVNAETLKIGVDVFTNGEFVEIGDPSRDGKITTRDALMILKSAAGLETYEADFNKLADVNADNVVNAEDALNVLKYAAKVLPVEQIVSSWADTYTVKLSNSADYEHTAKIIKSYSEYVKYIDTYLANDPDAFCGNAEEIKAKYDEEFFEYYYLMAVCVNNEISDTAMPSFAGIFRDNGTYEIKMNYFTPLEEQEGESSWCMFIRYSNSAIVYDDNCRINVVRENEVSVSEPVMGPVKSELKEYAGKAIEVISNYDDYLIYMSMFDENTAIRSEADSIYNEAYFEESELVVTCTFANAEAYDVVLDKITVCNDTCNIYIEALSPETDDEVNAYWHTFIPVEGKQWGDMDFNVELTEYPVSGKADDVDSAISASARISSHSLDEQIDVISTYDDYLEFIKSETVNNPNDLITGCTEKFFENNSLLVVYDWTSSGSHSMGFNRIEEADGKYLLYIDYFQTIFGTDDIGYWRITIPVEGKDWKNKSIEQITELDWLKGTRLDTYQWDINLHKIGENEDFKESVIELNSYEEYVNYVNAIIAEKPDAFEGNAEDVLAQFDETDFTDTSIAAINIVAEGAADYQLEFLGLIYAGDDKYNYTFKAYTKNATSPDTTNWCAFVTVPNEYLFDGYQLAVDVEYENSFDINSLEPIKIPVESDMDKNYSNIKLIDSYEEYSAYLENIAQNITDEYAAVYNYDESYFNDNVVVLVEYADESYSIESSLSDITVYDGKYVFYIEQYYPNIQHEGMKQWNMIIPLTGKQWLHKDLSLNITEVEEKGEDVKAKTMWVATHLEVTQSPYFIVYPSYSAYSKYMDVIKQHRKVTNGDYFFANKYNEEYFKENVVLMVVVDGSEDPYDATVVSKVTDDGQIILDIERNHKERASNNASTWHIFVPLEGKGWKTDNVVINYTDVYPDAN